jgi:hypothetical protein
VCKIRSLLGNGLHHFGASMADIHHADAAGKIDEMVPIDIFNDRALGSRGKHIHARGDAPGNRLLAACQQGA